MPPVSSFIARAWQTHQKRAPLAREVMGFLWLLAAGLLVLPHVIYAGGRLVLGDYLRDPVTGLTGGPLDFWLDYLRGLASLSGGHWLAALGPWVLLSAWRLARHWAWPATASASSARRQPRRR